MPNSACSSGRPAISAPLFCALTPDIPNVENHKRLTTVGTIRIPDKNSLIVLPFDTRAINIPTNGAHAIHQAQKKMVQSLTHWIPSLSFGAIRKLSTGSFCMYSPIELVKEFKIYWVGPKINVAINNSPANDIFVLLKYFIPLPRP